MAERGVFYYGEDKIHYDITRKAKSVNSSAHSRKVLIKVHPDQRVVVTAPHDASNDLIHAAALKRARWIWQNLQAFAKQTNDVLPMRYVSGETQFYLGRRYVLKVITDLELAADSKSNSVKLSRGKLNVALNIDAADAVKRASKIKILIDQWYLDRANIIFAERLAGVLPKATWVTDVPDFKILTMKKQWGSCSTKGRLILNPHLIKAPKDCIDYVILHELCHIAEHNHSESFWRLLTQIMPHWKQVKSKLDSMAEFYLNE